MTPRRRLRRTWGPFFSRFGRLTPVQGRTLEPLLAGHDVLVSSPTASGKTEAAVAPLVERHLPPGTDELRLLYLVPTRALANDLERRLFDPLRDMRLELGVKTGDKPGFGRRERVAVCVTTPESLDSMLCRLPERLDSLAAVVMDELHALDGSYRGDQLRVLLRRLPSGLQRVALSATVNDPDALVSRYLGADAQCILDGEPRPIEFTQVMTVEGAVQQLRAMRRHKAIVFCNRRRDVETLAVQLRELWPPDRIVVHHGSLSRSSRESAERAMREWTWGICVATMTLEMGVDIGDVDAVVLHGPPPTASAFRQRVGRACRRDPSITAIGIALEPDDEESFAELLALAEDGIVEPTDSPPDLSSVVQQTFSLLYAHPQGVPREELQRYFAGIVDSDDVDAIWEHLLDEGWLVRAPGTTLRAATRLMDRGERGQIHSNVPTPRPLQFKDASTGRVLGTATTELQVGDTVVVGGQARQVVALTGNDVALRPTSGAGEAPRYQRRRSGGAFRWLLPPHLRD